MKKMAFAFLVCLLSVSVLAVKPFLPPQCKVSGVRYEKSRVVFFKQHTTKPRLYAIQNVSKSVVWLTHESSGRGAGAGWDSRLTAGHWSALLMTRPYFNLTCHIQKANGAMKTVSCLKVIRVCQFSWLYSNNPISGGYWVGENLSLSDLMKRIHDRGFSV